ncbi:uncharacterized protein LOC100274297 [Zea mays]|uniref:Uncharacterized protein n=1 Tax=Zea mays TaxID=4577 RepID=B4G035_MAIZE|nr:uncharacterized protein LOC100274297 [Zea mays]ACF87728.1 unknown [Zea mays]|eukprot:NP_001142133.1 uncharacterized protein LOC100274297 [Zea mays]
MLLEAYRTVTSATNRVQTHSRRCVPAFLVATGIQALQAAAQGRRRRGTAGGAAAASGARGEVSRDAGRGLAPGDWRRGSGCPGVGRWRWEPELGLVKFFHNFRYGPPPLCPDGSEHGVPHSFWS